RVRDELEHMPGDRVIDDPAEKIVVDVRGALQTQEKNEIERDDQRATAECSGHRKQRHKQPATEIGERCLALYLKIEMNADRFIKPETDKRGRQRDRGGDRHP